MNRARHLRNVRRQRKARSVRRKVRGTPERPRLTVHRSSKQIYAQAVDDLNGITLAAASSLEKDLREKLLKDAVEEKDRLRVEKETVQKQLADAVALADTRQKDLDKVLKDNVDLKAALLKNKALTIVKLDARKTGETLDEGQINTRVDELLKKEDENKIDESLTARIMSMSVSQDPGKGAGADKLVADAKATPAASTGERKNEDKKVSDKVETQSLEHLDKMADMAFPGTDS